MQNFEVNPNYESGFANIYGQTLNNLTAKNGTDQNIFGLNAVNQAGTSNPIALNTDNKINPVGAKNSETDQAKLTAKNAVYSDLQNVSIASDKLMKTIVIMRKANLSWGFLLTPVQLKGNAVTQITESALKELLNESSSVNSKEKDIQSKVELIAKKSSYIVTEFNAKFAVLNTLVRLAPEITNLKQKGVLDNTGLNQIIFGILDGMDTSKPDYKNVKNGKDLDKLFGKRIKNMFGKEFTPEKIEKKLKPMQDKQKMLEKKLQEAEQKQDTQEIEKYKLQVEANKIGLDLLLLVKGQFDSILKGISLKD